MKKVLTGLVLLLMQSIGFSQPPFFEIPRDATLDSLFSIVNQKYEFDTAAIKRNQKYGWNKYSDKINADSFFIATKDYCIKRVGKAYFYENFRYGIHAFNDNVYSNIYTIRYRFYPPGLKEENYLDIIFESLDFLNIHVQSFPENLPDCRNDSTECHFPITREKAFEIIQTNLMVDQSMEIKVWEFNSDSQWLCSFMKNGQPVGRLYVDSRTGKMSDSRKWSR